MPVLPRWESHENNEIKLKYANDPQTSPIEFYMNLTTIKPEDDVSDATKVNTTNTGEMRKNRASASQVLSFNSLILKECSFTDA